MAVISPIAQVFYPGLSGFRFEGSALSLGTVEFYINGTLTLGDVYADRNAGAGVANPVQLDSNGRCNVFLRGIYNIVIKNSIGAIKDTIDGYEGNSVQDAVDTANELFIPEEIDTTAGDVVQMLEGGGDFGGIDASAASYVKTSADANVVTFDTDDGTVIAESGLTLETQNQMIEFIRVGNVWYRRQ